MDGVLIRGEERSSFEVNGPSVEEITNAFRASTGAPVLASSGSWVGPRPRITRATQAGAYKARAAWLWRFNDGLTPERRARLAEYLEANVGLQLAHQSPDWFTSRETYAPALHGNEEWWTSGRAAIATSQVEYPSQISRLWDPTENPSGPSNPATRPRTAAEALAGMGDTLAWMAVPVVLGIGLIYLGPAIGATATALAPKRKAHANPRRRRR